MLLAKSAHLQVQTDTGRSLRLRDIQPCRIRNPFRPGPIFRADRRAPCRDPKWADAGGGPREPGDFLKAASRGTPPAKRQSAHSESYTPSPPPGLSQGATIRESPPAPGVLMGAPKGRDARRSQTACQPNSATGLLRDCFRPGCGFGRAAHPAPFHTHSVRSCRGAPHRRHRCRPNPNSRRPRAAGRTHDIAAARAQRIAPWRQSI